MHLIKVDFHTHTHFSGDSNTPIAELIKSARACNLDRVVVTDHNVLAGALEAWRAAPDLIIPGEEIQTTEGELLAALRKLDTWLTGPPIYRIEHEDAGS